MELVTVEPFNSLCGSHLLGELDKAKPSWATGDVVNWHKNLCHVAHFGKKAFKLVLCRIVA
jgi:hypothetical protein